MITFALSNTGGWIISCLLLLGLVVWYFCFRKPNPSHLSDVLTEEDKKKLKHPDPFGTPSTDKK